jgi:hypothetical protein
MLIYISSVKIEVMIRPLCVLFKVKTLVSVLNHHAKAWFIYADSLLVNPSTMNDTVLRCCMRSELDSKSWVIGNGLAAFA